MNTIRVGTRGSQLARWQANYISGLLRAHYPAATIEIVILSTKGDQILDKSLPSIGGKGLFTAELERALLENEIDCAVHSLKDLPTDHPAGLTVGAIPARAPVEDVLISRGRIPLTDLPDQAVIGTSSLRRASQVKAARPDLRIIDIRGNVPTRIEKALNPDGPYDATILAQAGVERLGLMDQITEIMPLVTMLPAPGQGAIGVQCRDNAASLNVFAPLVDEPTRVAVTAERRFLQALGGGCAVPVAAYGAVDGDQIRLRGRVGRPDGRRIIEVVGETTLADAASLGDDLARQAIADGANEILAEVRG
jgi:hydroxymethylbilane synthase